MLLLASPRYSVGLSVDCPWSSDATFASSLAATCECSTAAAANGGGGSGGLSIDCARTNFTMLAAALQSHGQVGVVCSNIVV